ncbi:hypothetical protein BOKEGFJH_00177 [Chlamydia avium]|uniref:FtsL n=2 Tax=Chlamydia avium TaxID=1457141 RepID=W8JEQ3_9CHLA|nr:hypothetical protein [Chlamydia avium]AHK63051.1 Putative ftsL [Chlamydia avium 10DC88]EPP38004.1 putative ftsL [Chlamydia avium]VVT42667.1 hypothetical protein BOKEGFJH_00177 [Chlamydia avium]
MNKYRFLRLVICFCFFGSLLYFYVNKQNDLTKLQLEIPCLWSKLRQKEQENVALGFLIDKIESPEHLMDIARLPEYQYLHYPNEEKDCILIYESS